MSDMCTCGPNWRDDYCARHGLYKSSDRKIHELQKEIKELKLKPGVFHNAKPELFCKSCDTLAAELEKVKGELHDMVKAIDLSREEFQEKPIKARWYQIQNTCTRDPWWLYYLGAKYQFGIMKAENAQLRELLSECANKFEQAIMYIQSGESYQANKAYIEKLRAKLKPAEGE